MHLFLIRACRDVSGTNGASAWYGVARVIKVIAGFGVLVAGIVMLAVPGPGWLTIAAGLAILAAEFAWARRALDSMKILVFRLRRGLPKDSKWLRRSESRSSER
jgi:uncharacterized protein (TIGR02611 family)